MPTTAVVLRDDGIIGLSIPSEPEVIRRPVPDVLATDDDVRFVTGLVHVACRPSDVIVELDGVLVDFNLVTTVSAFDQCIDEAFFVVEFCGC